MASLIVTDAHYAFVSIVWEALGNKGGFIERLNACLVEVIHNPLCAEQVLEKDIVWAGTSSC